MKSNAKNQESDEIPTKKKGSDGVRWMTIQKVCVNWMGTQG